MGRSNVVHHNAAHLLQTNKGVNAVIDFANRQRLGFRPLVVAAVVERIISRTICIEVFAENFGGDSLKVLPRIKYQLAEFVPDAERASAV